MHIRHQYKRASPLSAERSERGAPLRWWRPISFFSSSFARSARVAHRREESRPARWLELGKLTADAAPGALLRPCARLDLDLGALSDG